MPLIYHITPRADWLTAQASGEYHAESLRSQGYIHLSQAHQVIAVADALYRGKNDLVLLCVETEKLRPPLRYELPDVALPVTNTVNSPDDLFPHLYGALNTDAVVEVVDFVPGADGRFTMPPRS